MTNSVMEAPAPEVVDAYELKDAIRKRITTMEDAIAAALANMILRGDFQPGERLNQSKLAEMFGVSRVPIRAAFRTLSAEGLIESSNRFGTVVAKLSKDDFVVSYLLRYHLEPFLAAWACERASVQDTQRLTNLLQRMDYLHQEIDREGKITLLREWVEVDREFHLQTYRPVLSVATEQILQTLWKLSQRFRRVYAQPPYPLAHSLSDHHRLLEAFVMRDSPAVKNIVASHIRNFLSTSLPETSELFNSVDRLEAVINQ